MHYYVFLYKTSQNGTLQSWYKLRVLATECHNPRTFHSGNFIIIHTRLYLLCNTLWKWIHIKRLVVSSFKFWFINNNSNYDDNPPSLISLFSNKFFSIKSEKQWVNSSIWIHIEVKPALTLTSSLWVVNYRTHHHECDTNCIAIPHNPQSQLIISTLRVALIQLIPKHFLILFSF